MRKYWAIARAGFLNSLVYRADTFLWGFAELFDTLVFLFIWIVLFGEKNTIGGFTLSETITYLIGVGIIVNILDTWVAHDIERDVQSGRMSDVLTKPVSYFFVRVVMSLAGKPLSLLVRFTVYGLIAFSFKEKFILNSNLVLLMVLFLSIFLAYFINYLIEFLFGCLAFWMTRIRGASGILRTIRGVFSGGYAPLTFFPPLFQTVAKLLPFAYTRYFPMLIYLNKLDTMGIIKGLLVQVFWIIALLFLTKKIWRCGLRRYEGVGI